MFPSLKEATTDRLLRGAPIHVLAYLHTTLDPVEFRPVKQWWVAKEVGLERTTVMRALTRLVEHGYLDAGQTDEKNVTRYRLIANREVEQPTKPRAAA